MKKNLKTCSCGLDFQFNLFCCIQVFNRSSSQKSASAEEGLRVFWHQSCGCLFSMEVWTHLGDFLPALLQDGDDGFFWKTSNLDFVLDRRDHGTEYFLTQR